MQMSQAFRDAVIDDCVDEFNSLLGSSASIVFWTGSPPANCETSPSGSQVATCPLSSTVFAAAVAGVTIANTITPDTNTNSGTIGYFRFTSGAGAVIFQGTCGTSSPPDDFVFDDLTFSTGDTLTVDDVEIEIIVTP